MKVKGEQDNQLVQTLAILTLSSVIAVLDLDVLVTLLIQGGREAV